MFDAETFDVIELLKDNSREGIMRRREFVARAMVMESHCKFDMDTWAAKRECDSVGCIAGTTLAIFYPQLFTEACKSYGSGAFTKEAAVALGLASSDAKKLFWAEWTDDPETNETKWHASAEEAAAMLLSMPVTVPE